ncbi:MAG: hypothetical protein ABFS37_04340 [Acidobacteriota bacterium]
MRIFWALTLCFFLSGCSYQQFGLPRETEPVHEVGGNDPVVKIGQVVTIVTVDGSEHDGEVVAVSAGQIVLGKSGNYGFEETVFQAEDIKEIKTRKIPGLVSGILIGTAVLMALLLLGLSQMEWPSS